MRRSERSRERYVETAAQGLRFFQLYENLARGGSALAYPVHFNRTTRVWQKLNQDTARRTIYDGLGLGGKSAGDKLQAVYMPSARRWELVVGVGVDDGIPFRNDFAGTVPPGGIMYWFGTATLGGIETALTTRPTVFFDRFWLVNRPSSVVEGAFGTADLLIDAKGLCAMASSPAPTAGQSWGPKPDSFLLHHEYTGFTVVNHNQATIESQTLNTCVQHQVLKVFGKLYEDIEQGGEAEFEIWHRRDGKLRVSGWGKIDVHDFYLNQDETREAGTKGEATWYSDHWEAAFACEVDNTDDSGNSSAGQMAAAAGAADGTGVGDPSWPIGGPGPLPDLPPFDPDTPIV